MGYSALSTKTAREIPKSNDWDTIYKEAMKKSTIWCEYQVAKFYYSLENEYIAWNTGVVIRNGKIMPY